MPKTELRQWLLLIIVVVSAWQTSCQPIIGEQHPMKVQSVPALIGCGNSYSNIMRALRDNWESPITYLKKRGYLPKNSEVLFADNVDGNNQLLIEVSDDNRAELLQDNQCERNKFERDENVVNDLTNTYKAMKDPFSYIAEPRKGFLGTMRDKLFGLFGSSKKTENAQAKDTNDRPPLKLNEPKLLTKMPVTVSLETQKQPEYVTPFINKDFKVSNQHKYDSYNIGNSNNKYNYNANTNANTNINTNTNSNNNNNNNNNNAQSVRKLT